MVNKSVSNFRSLSSALMSTHGGYERTPHSLTNHTANRPIKASLKESNNMKIHKMIYQDRKVRQIGMSANNSRRPDKVLFLVEPQSTHMQVPQAETQTKTYQRVQFYQRFQIE